MSRTLWKVPTLFFWSCTLMTAASLEQEATTFLTRWLVDGDIERAVRFVADRGLLCVPSNDIAEVSGAKPPEARARLRGAMGTVLKAVGKHNPKNGN